MELEPKNNQHLQLENNDCILPCALITNSCSSIFPENVVKEILGRETLPPAVRLLDGIRSFSWHIDTKYYEADVSLCIMEKKTLGNQEFANSVNAVLICFDSNSPDGLAVVEQWFTFTKEFQPDIQILVCDQCKPDSSLNGVTKVQAQTWCVKHGFELVELNPEESEVDSDVEDDFQESLGIKRVVQALQAHLWPNLTLKDRDRVTPHAGLQSVINGVALLGLNSNYEANVEENIYGTTANSYAITSSPPYETPEQKYSDSKPISQKIVAAVKPIVKSPIVHEYSDSGSGVVSSNSGTTESDISLNQVVNFASSSAAAAVEPHSTEETAVTTARSPRNERIDSASMLQAMDSMSEDTFEKLFQNLNEMKTKAQNLSPSQRKDFAQQMAVAFWRSMGGNESEIDGLCSDETDDDA